MDLELRNLIANYSNKKDSSIIKELVTQSKPLSLSDVLVDPNSNLNARMQTFVPNETKLREFPQSLNAAGMVFKHAPTTAFVSKHDKNVDTITHEAAHTQQNMNPHLKGLFKEAYPDVRNVNFRDPVSISNFERAKLKYKEREAFQKQALSKIRQLEPLAPYDLLPYNSGSNMKEAGASLQAIEAQMQQGSTVWQHPWIKGTFTPQEQKELERYMYSKYDKLSEGPPKTALEHAKSLDWMDIIQRNIRNWTAK